MCCLERNILLMLNKNRRVKNKKKTQHILMFSFSAYQRNLHKTDFSANANCVNWFAKIGFAIFFSGFFLPHPNPLQSF